MEDALKHRADFDPFDNQTLNPDAANALQSYLWELYVLLHHYDPNVVKMMQKLQVKLVRTRQQFGNVVNSSYENEFERLLKEKETNVAPAVRNLGFLPEGSVLSKTYF